MKTGDKVRIKTTDHPYFCKGSEVVLGSNIQYETHGITQWKLEGYPNEHEFTVYTDEIEPINKLEQVLV